MCQHCGDNGALLAFLVSFATAGEDNYDLNQHLQIIHLHLHHQTETLRNKLKGKLHKRQNISIIQCKVLTQTKAN